MTENKKHMLFIAVWSQCMEDIATLTCVHEGSIAYITNDELLRLININQIQNSEQWERIKHLDKHVELEGIIADVDEGEAEGIIYYPQLDRAWIYSGGAYALAQVRKEIIEIQFKK